MMRSALPFCEPHHADDEHDPPALAAATRICHGWMPSLELAGEVYLVVVVVAVVVVATGPYSNHWRNAQNRVLPNGWIRLFLSLKSESERFNDFIRTRFR